MSVTFLLGGKAFVRENYFCFVALIEEFNRDQSLLVALLPVSPVMHPGVHQTFRGLDFLVGPQDDHGRVF